MSLSVHERRVLADIEHRLAECDPSFVERLSSLERVMCAPEPARAEAPRQQRCGRHAMRGALIVATVVFLVALAMHRPLMLSSALLVAMASPLLRLVVDVLVLHSRRLIPRRLPACLPPWRTSGGRADALGPPDAGRRRRAARPGPGSQAEAA